MRLTMDPWSFRPTRSPYDGGRTFVLLPTRGTDVYSSNRIEPESTLLH
jgi:hypothetical protein